MAVATANPLFPHLSLGYHLLFGFVMFLATAGLSATLNGVFGKRDDDGKQDAT